MPSRRVTVIVGVGAIVAAVVAVAILVLRDEETTASGDLIAFGCKEPRNPWYAICLMKSDGTERRRITSQLPTTDPAWSPDGRQIALTRNEDVGEFTTVTDDDVFVMAADGSGLRQLTPERTGRSSGQPTWSPDGRLIAYVHGPSVDSAVPSRFGGLFVMSADGTGPRRLTQGRADTDPDWSPDGNEIAFIRGENLSSPTEQNMDIYTTAARGGSLRRLTRTAHLFESAPVWSPDGSRIAFARFGAQSQFDGKAGVYVINHDGTDEKLVLEHQHFADGPYSLAWSPDGRMIAFETSSAIGCTSISVVDVDGGAPRPLTTCARPIESTVSPAWQPAADAGAR